jgi:GT2 family glycosyltransferase
MKISVVVPTCLRPPQLARCLESIKESDEIVVSDDGDSPALPEFLANDKVRWVKGPARGPAANRNSGARVATGEWLAFMDDDCVADSGWLAAIRTAADRADVVEGKTVCPDRSGHWLEHSVENLSGGELWSCNLAIRRSSFEQLGGFDERFLIAGGEDLEFRSRIRKAGLRLLFEPRMLVYHPIRRLNFGQWFRGIFRQHWHLLYRLIVTDGKSGAIAEVLDFFRVTKRAFLGFSSADRPSSLVRVIATWILLPVWTVYLLFWEWRFKKRHFSRHRRLQSGNISSAT